MTFVLETLIFIQQTSELKRYLAQMRPNYNINYNFNFHGNVS